MNNDTGQAGWTRALGQYAGAASRFAAYAIDVIVSWAAFTLALAGVSFAIRIVTGRSVNWHPDTSIAVAVVFAVWEIAYFGYCWAAAGRTAGMALFGLRVVRADGADLDPWRGVLRALVFPLSIILCGLGFVGILVQREHRALHDLLAGTAVIYSWDARATRLRLLARTAGRSSSGLGAASPAQGEADFRRMERARFWPQADQSQENRRQAAD
ncbi:MAG TPA: RDD family protein [Trebonia sp.]|nr:RDD family protein [Trebonia sp.]